MNEYTPWIELGITELEYWKARYIEARQELQLAIEGLEYYGGPCAIPFDGGHKARAILEQLNGKR